MGKISRTENKKPDLEVSFMPLSLSLRGRPNPLSPVLSVPPSSEKKNLWGSGGQEERKGVQFWLADSCSASLAASLCRAVS